MDNLKLMVLVLMGIFLSYGNLIYATTTDGGSVITEVDFKNHVMVLVDTENEQANVLNIYAWDQSGNKTVLNACGSPKCSIDVSSILPKGVYEIEVETSTGTTFAKEITIE